MRRRADRAREIRLAGVVGCDPRTVRRFLEGHREMHATMLDAIQRAVDAEARELTAERTSSEAVERVTGKVGG